MMPSRQFKPVEILYAEIALWAWTAWACLYGIYTTWKQIPDIEDMLNNDLQGMISITPDSILHMAIGGYVGLAVLSAWIVWKIGQGKHWARSSLMWGFALEAVVEVFPPYHAPLEYLSEIPELGLQLFALWYLYRPPGSRWFRQSMILRRSRFIHSLPVGKDRFLVVHAVSHMRLPVDRDIETLLNFFAEPRRVPEDCAPLAQMMPFALDAIITAIKGMVDRQVLTDKSPEEELAAISASLAPTQGRDPGEMLEHYRRGMQEGTANSYWSASAAYKVGDFTGGKQRVDAVLLGDCDIQMESDFLRREADGRGIDLRIAATFPDDVRFVSEHKHDIVLVGALRARHTIVEPHTQDKNAHATYIALARQLLVQIREKTSAPILIDNLPEPTVQPLGFAEHGVDGHRLRFRHANVALAELAASVPGVYVVDIAAAMARQGAERMLDDWQLGFTHFGSPGWLLQRPEREKAAVHNLFSDIKPLADWLGGNPYGREAAMAVPHIDALMTVLGIGRKKCVIVDLDGTLWPGVLAETGSPFAWRPEVSGVFSYVGIYFGLHEALLCLKKRGVVLACVSKNDEKTVRDLWKYPDYYPKTLLKPEDFVTWRVNWNDKVDNIRSIAEELGFALESFLFIDDHPVERDRVRQRLPEVEVWGEDPFGLRRKLLNDPRLQLPVITGEAAQRSEHVKAQLGRQHLRAEVMDEATYIASLNIQCRIERLAPGTDKLARVEELFQRTTQFNTTNRKFFASELEVFLKNPAAYIFSLEVSDRFGEHGLVGAVVVADGEILGFAMSCRVLGMSVEKQFMQRVLGKLKPHLKSVSGHIFETARNIPVRNVYRDNGFTEVEPGLWKLDL